MSTIFDPVGPAIRVPGVAAGPQGTSRTLFTLDTGSSRTVLRPSYLRVLGCDLNRPVGWVTMRSATDEVTRPLILVPRVTVLGHSRSGFPLVAHEFPTAVRAGALLGLDFFRGLVLTLDFATGRIDLRPPRRWWQLWR